MPCRRRAQGYACRRVRGSSAARKMRQLAVLCRCSGSAARRCAGVRAGDVRKLRTVLLQAWGESMHANCGRRTSCMYREVLKSCQGMRSDTRAVHYVTRVLCTMSHSPRRMRVRGQGVQLAYCASILGAKVGACGRQALHALVVRSRTCGCVRRGAAHGEGRSFFDPAYGC